MRNLCHILRPFFSFPLFFLGFFPTPSLPLHDDQFVLYLTCVHAVRLKVNRHPNSEAASIRLLMQQQHVGSVHIISSFGAEPRNVFVFTTGEI